MKREKWIDVLKGIAIIAVMIDHFFFIFSKTRNQIVWTHTYFSIPWFIFLVGVTSAISLTRRKDIIRYWRGRLKILMQYVLANILVYLVIFWNSGCLTLPLVCLNNFWMNLLNFSLQPPYYFINIILQLYLIAPFLYYFVRLRKNKLYQLIIALAVFSLSFVLSLKYPFWPFTPAGRMFGGKLLFVFYLGMIYSLKIFKIDKKILLTALILFLYYEKNFIDSSYSFLGLAVTYEAIIWSISLLFMVKMLIDKIIVKMKVTGFMVNVLAYLGRNSIIIFLYHFMVYSILYRYSFNFLH